MGEDTKIQWADDTFNGVIGCAEARFPDGRMHDSCANCYAREGMGRRRGVKWGTVAEGGTRLITGDDNWKKPEGWARAAAKAGTRRKVFAWSLGDVLDPDVPRAVFDRQIDLVLRTGSACGYCGLNLQEAGHDRGCPGGPVGGLWWLFLTKRPERAHLIPERARRWIWLGTSIADQATADAWVPRLVANEGFPVRFVSAEPMIGPVDLTRWLGPHAVSWVISGGESGRKRDLLRSYNLAWPRALLGQCRAAGSAFFHKQTGVKVYEPADKNTGQWSHADGGYIRRVEHKDEKGGDPAEWPEDLRVREFPKLAA